MQDLLELLRKVPDTYAVFVITVSRYAERATDDLEAVKQFILAHPAARASDILGFIFAREEQLAAG